MKITYKILNTETDQVSITSQFLDEDGLVVTQLEIRTSSAQRFVFDFPSKSQVKKVIEINKKMTDAQINNLFGWFEIRTVRDLIKVYSLTKIANS